MAWTVIVDEFEPQSVRLNVTAGDGWTKSYVEPKPPDGDAAARNALATKVHTQASADYAAHLARTARAAALSTAATTRFNQLGGG